MPSIDRNIFILSERIRNFVIGNRTWNQDMKRNLNSDDQQFQHYRQNKHGCFILMTVLQL